MSWLSRITGRDASRREGREAAALDAKMNTAMGDEQARTLTQEGQARNDRAGLESTLAGGQDALNASITAAMSAAMPDLFRTLQQTKESNLRRGMMNGETPTSYEGDVMSAFQRNIANAAGGQAMNLHNTNVGARTHLFDVSTGLGERSRERYLDVLSGQMDRKQAERNANQQQRSQNWQAAGKFVTNLVDAVNPFKIGKKGGK
jgi:hypothetical protein